MERVETKTVNSLHSATFCNDKGREGGAESSKGTVIVHLSS
jgi:hypothetical protein